MLIEAIHYLTTPASRAQRRLGYLSESVSAAVTFAPLPSGVGGSPRGPARSAIMQSCADLVRRRTAVILGSGLLDDVPLSYLAERFERVILVDMIHPWPARWMARRHANVSLQIVDLSGCANWLRGEGERACRSSCRIQQRRCRSRRLRQSTLTTADPARGLVSSPVAFRFPMGWEPRSSPRISGVWRVCGHMSASSPIPRS